MNHDLPHTYGLYLVKRDISVNGLLNFHRELIVDERVNQNKKPPRFSGVYAPDWIASTT